MGSRKAILTVNAGSSSIKLVFFAPEPLAPLLRATVTNIGQPGTMLFLEEQSHPTQSRPVHADNHEAAVTAVFDWLESRQWPTDVSAIGHRVVHGGQKYNTSVIVDGNTMDDLKQIAPLDPEHTQAAVRLLEIFGRRFTQVTQVACFDTAFYKDMPELARLLPLPRKFELLGLCRYGFHGLSYEYVLDHFRKIAGETAANGRIVLAHLGSGASLTAVKGGKPIDTTMSFTPASGVLMSTRAGDLDPGIIAFLHQQTGMTIDEFNHMIHFESGLLGVSGLSADMELLIRESAHNRHAAEAVDLFCYHARKAIGGLAAALGGVDSLIFSGGIGENAPLIREKICQGLDYLGMALDEQRNRNHEFLISRDNSGAGVHVVHTDEAAVIAAHTLQCVKGKDA